MTTDCNPSEPNFLLQNRAFLYGDAISAYFFVHHGRLIMAEECYFYLMASMRKLRLRIPLEYTPEFFTGLLSGEIDNLQLANGILRLMVYRQAGEVQLEKAEVSLSVLSIPLNTVFAIQNEVTVDLIREIEVSRHFLGNLRTAKPENIYAEIYARENDLQDLILLNTDKRIARSIFGNYLFLEGNVIKIPKTSEGAYISPLLENFVTFIHKNRLAEISECEMAPFETQKAEEILIISDEKGIFAVKDIRRKAFGHERFTAFLQQWEESFQV